MTLLAFGRRRRLPISLAVALAWLAGSRADAEYAVDWFKISAGGGTSLGGDFSMSGTVGQSDVGTMDGGDYALQGGFWGLTPRAPAPSRPVLSVVPTGTNTVVLSWPSLSIQFVLEESGRVNPGVWTAVDAAPFRAGARWLAVVPRSAGSKFYRLRSP